MGFVKKEQVWTYVHCGASLINKREENMDNFLIAERMINKRSVLICVVCDGVGSLTEGGYASETAVKLLSEWFHALADTDEIGLRLRDEIINLNDYIFKEAHKTGIKTASTLSAIVFVDDAYTIAHLGDSRIYTIKDNEFIPLTKDDVVDGKLSAAIGHYENTDIHMSGGKANGQLFLVCSDGFYKRLDPGLLFDKKILRGKAAMENALHQCISYVTAQGENDNITAALIRVFPPVRSFHLYQW